MRHHFKEHKFPNYGVFYGTRVLWWNAMQHTFVNPFFNKLDKHPYLVALVPHNNFVVAP